MDRYPSEGLVEGTKILPREVPGESADPRRFRPRLGGRFTYPPTPLPPWTPSDFRRLLQPTLSATVCPSTNPHVATEGRALKPTFLESGVLRVPRIIRWSHPRGVSEGLVDASLDAPSGGVPSKDVV